MMKSVGEKRRYPTLSGACVRNMSPKENRLRIPGIGVIGVLLNYATARMTSESSLRRLVRAMASADEDTATAAYMALVKLGPSNAVKLVEMAKVGPATANLLQLLGDLGDPSIIPDLEEFARSSDLAVASAARESIAVLRWAESDRE